HPIGRIPVREPTILEPQWYLNKEVRQGDTGITNHYPESLKNLIKQTLNKNPERRIAAEAILQLPEVAAILKTN
ncbi:MAG: hypothetical protein EZS28_012097, partial [Streblomastix strix]